MKKGFRRFVTVLTCMSLVTGATVTIKPAESGAKSKFGVSKKAGTYTKSVKTTIKANKGYKVYYKTSGKFNTKKVVKSGKKKSLKIKKTSTLSLIVVKKSVKVKAKTLNSKAYKKKIVKYKYKIKTTTGKATAAPASAVATTSAPGATAETSTTPGTATETKAPEATTTAAAKKVQPKFEIKDGVLVDADVTGTKSLVIPNGVKKIAKGVFDFNKEIENVYLPDGLEEIGEDAFNECTALSRIYIPASIKKIGDYAFFQCSSLEELSLGDATEDMVDLNSEDNYCPMFKLEEIGEGAFFGCEALINFDIPGNVKKIGDYAFGFCSALSVLTIGDGVEEIPSQMCWKCKSLTGIDIPKSVKKIGSRAFMLDDALQNVTYEEGSELDEIGESAFEGCNLRGDLVVNAKKIGVNAFSGSTIVNSLTIAEGVESIGDGAFESVTISDEEDEDLDLSEESDDLVNISLPKSLKEIGESALSIVGVKGFDVDEDNKNFNDIDGVIYDEKNETLVVYPLCKPESKCVVQDGTKVIGDSAFECNDAVKEVVLPDSLEKIDEEAFDRTTNLETVELPESLKSIGAAAFNGTNIVSIDIPNSVTELGKATFSDCIKLTNVNIGNGIKELPDLFLNESKRMTGIKIPKNVESISTTALVDSGIEYVNIDLSDNTNFKVDDKALLSGDGKTFISYESVGTLSEDEEAEGETTDIEEDENVDRNDREREDFDDDMEEESIEYTVPEGVETIKKGAFSGTKAKSVDKIFIPDSLKTIENCGYGYTYSNDNHSAVFSRVLGRTIIGRDNSPVEKYAIDNLIGYFSEDSVPSDEKITMSMNDNKSFTVKGACDESTVYFSSNSNIVKIDQNTGKLTPVAKGETDVIAVSGSKYFICDVVVTDGPEPEVDKYTKKYREIFETDLNSWLREYTAYNNMRAIIKKHYPAIREYSGNDYPRIVATFHGEGSVYFNNNMSDLGKDYGQYVKIGKNLDRELRQTDLNEDTMIFRGTEYVRDITGGNDTIFDLINSVGKQYSPAAVSSTSLRHATASGFGGGEWGFVLEIYADKDNAPGMYIASFSQFPDEAEYLLAPKIKYDIVGAGVRTIMNKWTGEKDIERYFKLKIVE